MDNVKDPAGKFASAHIAVPASYVEDAATLVDLPIPVQYREGVRLNLQRAAAIARPLFAWNLTEETESAPVFEP